jgi:hypothetical protein
MQNLEAYTENSANGVNISTMGSTDTQTQFKMGPMGGDVTLKSGAGDILLVTGEGKAVKVNGVALGDLATKNEADLDLTSKQDKLSEVQLAAVNSGITAAKVGEYDTVKSTVDTNKETWDKAGTAVQAVGSKAVDGGAAFTVDGNEYAWLQSTDGAKLSIGYIDANGPIPAQIIFNTNGLEAAGAAAAVQGATTNTVKDCVDAINTMNGQVGSTIGTVENIVSQLTWGSF